MAWAGCVTLRQTSSAAPLSASLPLCLARASALSLSLWTADKDHAIATRVASLPRPVGIVKGARMTRKCQSREGESRKSIVHLLRFSIYK